MAQVKPQGYNNLGPTPYKSPLSLGYTPPTSGLLNQNYIAPKAPLAPVNQPITSHSVIHPDGTTVTQKYDTKGWGWNADTKNIETNPGLIKKTSATDNTQKNPSVQIPAVNTLDTTTGMYSSGASTPTTSVITGTPSTPVPTPPPPVPTVGTTATGLVGIGQTEQDIANQAGQAYADVGQAGARGEEGYLTAGLPNPVAQGAAAMTAQNTAAQQNAIMQGAQTQLQGVTAAQTGLNQAGQLVSPTGNFPFVFNPATGTFTTAGGTGTSTNGISFTGNPTTDADTAAQAVISGKMTYQQAQQSMSYAGTTANNYLNSAILAKGGDVSALEAQGAAKQSNITTSATTPTTAAATVYAQTYNDLLNIKNTTGNVDQLGTLLVNNMQTINPTDFKLGNKTIAQFRDALSSDQQAIFDTTFAQLKAQIASLLSTGGGQIPTQITADANKIIDGSAPVGTLNATLARIKTEGNILTGNIQNKLNTAGGVISAPVSGSNNNPAGI